MAEPFVGRTRELTRLRNELQLAMGGHRRVTMLAGEPGIGKTRLAMELTAHAQRAGALAITGRCYELGGAPLYWPWVQALRLLIAAWSPEHLANDLGAAAPMAATILPDLAARIPQLRPYPVEEGDADSISFLQCEAVASLLARAARRQPLLIVLEDLQWADGGSLRLLIHLVRAQTEAPIYVVGTLRDDELDMAHPLTGTLGELTRESGFRRDALSGLTVDEVDSFLRRARTVTSSSDLAHSIHDLTSGNPLYVGQLVRHIAEDHAGGQLRLDRATLRERLPQGLRDVVGNRIRRLSTRCTEILQVSCLFGTDFDLAQLTPACERTAQEVMAAVEEAVRAHVMQAVDGEQRRFRFAHAVIAETVRAELPIRKKAELHARIGEALERYYGRQVARHADEIAMHFEAAQQIVGRSRYARAALAAGLQALAAGASEHALSQLAKGSAALASEPMDDLGAELLLGQARALAAMGHVEEAEAKFEQAFEQFERSGNHRQATVVTAEIGRSWATPGDKGLRWAPRSCAAYERAVRATREDSAARPRVLASWALCVGIHGNDYDRACDLLQEATDTAEALEDAALVRFVLDSWAMLDYRCGRYGGYAEKRERVVQLARQSGDVLAEAQALRLLAHALPLVGRLEEADGLTQELLQVAEQAGDTLELLRARQRAAFIAYFRGDWRTTRQLLDLVLAAPPQTEVVLLALYQRLLLEYETGNFREGSGYLDRLSALARGTNATGGGAAYYELLGIIVAALATGETTRLDEARERAQAMLADDNKSLAFQQNAHAFLSAIAALTGDTELAREQYEALHDMPLTRDVLYLATGYGVVARMVGELDESVRALQAARATPHRMVVTYVRNSNELAETLYVRNRGDDRQQAREIWSTALETAERLGLMPLAERIRARVHETGSARRPARPDGLSSRELDVLRLIARGRTNKEIAAQLFISQKTVESHITRLFAKAGVSSRLQASLYAREQGIG